MIRSTRPSSSLAAPATASSASALRTAIRGYLLKNGATMPQTDRARWPKQDAKKAWRAPNGDALQRIDIRLPNPDSSVQFALVDAKTKQFYFVRAGADQQPGMIQGPVALPTPAPASSWPIKKWETQIKTALETQHPAGTPNPALWPTIDTKKHVYKDRDGAKLVRVPVRWEFPDTPVQYGLVNPATHKTYYVRADASGKPLMVDGPFQIPG